MSATISGPKFRYISVRRTVSVNKKFFTSLLGLSIAFTLAGCQGVGSNATSTSTPPTITLNQSSVTLAAGASTQFTATVQNISNTTVAWSVDGVAGGNCDGWKNHVRWHVYRASRSGIAHRHGGDCCRFVGDRKSDGHGRDDGGDTVFSFDGAFE